MMNEYTGFEVAVIGMAGKFPDANGTDEFWKNLLEGKESIEFWEDDELIKAGASKDLLAKNNFVKTKGACLSEKEYFDFLFFRYTPVEAETMDPQIRSFHECSWHALEDAAYIPEKYKGKIGVFAGASANLNWRLFQISNSRASDWEVKHLSDKDFMSTRLSYNLDLKGPSFTLYSACSTSLVAVHQASQSLINGECDLALAGGATIAVGHCYGYEYQESMKMSKDGHIRPFDSEASGINLGEGVGVVVLKRLSEAIKDNDNIYAVIKGSAINNDGRNKVGYTAPSIQGQTDVLKSSLRMSFLKPDDISYIETHGTATNLGDPIEFEALKAVFKNKGQKYCNLGSVKANIGHLDCAAGVASFIKTALVLKNRVIPPQINFQKPNPKCDFENSPFQISTQAITLSKAFPINAGVSSFGIGGTNAHVVLQEAPIVNKKEDQAKERLFVVSAKSITALENSINNIKQLVFDNTDINYGDTAFTLMVGRGEFKYRGFFVLKNEENKSGADLFDNTEFVDDFSFKQNVAFVFGGLGSQTEYMGNKIAQENPYFRKQLEHCLEISKLVIGEDISFLFNPNIADKDASEAIKSIRYSSLIKFITEYSLAKLLMHLGVEPAAMIGHSFGEYIVACLAGVFSLEDALKTIEIRAILMEKTMDGLMLSIPLGVSELNQYLAKDVYIAAINSDQLTLVSGTISAIEALEQKLRQDNIECLRINFPKASHSDLMLSVADEFEESFNKISLNKPKFSYISGLTGKWISDEEAVSSKYWRDHLCTTIDFSSGVKLLKEELDPLYIQIGSDKGLQMIVSHHYAQEDDFRFFNVLKHPKSPLNEFEFLLHQLGNLWINGIRFKWEYIYEGEERRRISLPKYCFDKYEVKAFVPLTENTKENEDLANTKQYNDERDWFYKPVLKKLKAYKDVNQGFTGKWMIVGEDNRYCNLVFDYLSGLSDDIVLVLFKDEFEHKSNRLFYVNPENEDHFDRVFRTIENTEEINIISVNMEMHHTENISEMESLVSQSYFYLVNLINKANSCLSKSKVSMHVLTSDVYSYDLGTTFNPALALISGLTLGASLEFSNMNIRNIDVVLPKIETYNEQVMLKLIANELIEKSDERIVVLHGKNRYKLAFEKIYDYDLIKTQKLKSNGTYVITGGIGGVGLVLADFLTKEYNSNVILLTHSNFPAKTEWGKLLASEGADKKTLKRIKQLMLFEQRNQNVKLLKADASNLSEMEDVFRYVISEYGTLDGIIHSAGNPDGNLIKDVSPDKVKYVLKPKVTGSKVISNLVEKLKLDLDFIVYCSSTNSFLPKIGNALHTSANLFMDIYANYINTQSSIPLISVNWSGWKEAGQANDDILNQLKLLSQVKELDNKIFDFYIDYDQIKVFVAIISSFQWFVNEHRINGKATMPGTGFIDLVNQAIKIQTESDSVVIEEFYLSKPLIIDEVFDRYVLVLTEEKKEENRFVVVSFDLNKLEITEHAIGKFKTKDLEKIGHLTIDPEMHLINPVHITPKSNKPAESRWTNCLKSIGRENNIVVKQLELSELYIDDLNNHQLHPALLDCAFGISEDETSQYLPYYYGKLIVHKPLTQSLLCYMKGKSKSVNDTAKTYDILILNEEGEILVEVIDYVRLMIKDTNSGVEVKSKINDDSGAQLDSDYALYFDEIIQIFKESNLHKFGITNQEGVQIIKNALQMMESQVIVSKKDLNIEVKNTESNTPNLSTDKKTKAKKKLAVPRPSISAKYEKPANECQELLAKVFENSLGFSNVGINDDFFELGGDSLKAVYVLNSIYKEFTIRISIADFFISPNIKDLSLKINSLQDPILDENNSTNEREEIII